jgi:hypothetical protein
MKAPEWTRTAWRCYLDSPHKVMFVVLVALLAASGTAVVHAMYNPATSPDALRALKEVFGEIAERATWMAGVIAGFAKITDVVAAATQGKKTDADVH